MPRGPELIVIVAVIILLFGARKLPELARSLGASAKEFRKGLDDGSDDTVTEASAESPEKSESSEK